MNTHEQKHRNDQDGLHAIHRFGWLRPAELGKFLWPDSAHSQKMAERLARSWIERHLVIPRILPDGAGRILVLSSAGVRLLDKVGINAASGKDIGRFPPGGWLPPASWRHDLIAQGVLIELYNRGLDIVTEVELRRHETNPQRKIPDGLAIQGKYVIWLEVEQARKTGQNMSDLANAIIQIALGNVRPRMGLMPTTVMVAYTVFIRTDEYGNRSIGIESGPRGMSRQYDDPECMDEAEAKRRAATWLMEWQDRSRSQPREAARAASGGIAGP